MNKQRTTIHNIPAWKLFVAAALLALIAAALMLAVGALTSRASGQTQLTPREAISEFQQEVQAEVHASTPFSNGDMASLERIWRAQCRLSANEVAGYYEAAQAVLAQGRQHPKSQPAYSMIAAARTVYGVQAYCPRKEAWHGATPKGVDNH